MRGSAGASAPLELEASALMGYEVVLLPAQMYARAEADVSADAAARRDFALSAARDAPPPADEAQALEHARVAALLQGALEAVDKAAEQKQAANDDAEVTAMEV